MSAPAVRLHHSPTSSCALLPGLSYCAMQAAKAVVRSENEATFYTQVIKTPAGVLLSNTYPKHVTTHTYVHLCTPYAHAHSEATENKDEEDFDQFLESVKARQLSLTAKGDNTTHHA